VSDALAGGAGSPPLIVAIDGPSGVGKSTAARLLARRLGVPYLDTGAMYRALALDVLDRGIDPADDEAVVAATDAADLRLAPEADGGFAVLLAGEPVEERIRTFEVGEATSIISTYPAVRERLVAIQRACAAERGAVVEGRDIGTRVFPDTPFKFFLNARSQLRYRRRYDQLREGGEAVSYDEVVEELDARDERDAGREASPLSFDDSYTEIDTSEISAEEVAERMARRVLAETEAD
jgi:cytidylate kinase